MLIAGTAFFLGLVVVFFLPLANLPPFIEWSLLLGSCGIAWWLGRALRRFAYGYSSAIVGACLLAGMVWGQWNLSRYQAEQLPLAWESRDFQLTGVVSEIPQLRGGRWSFFLDVHGTEPGFLLQRVKLNWYQAEQELALGQVWRFRVRLKRPHGYHNPGGFDYQQWLVSRQIGGTGYVRGDAELLASPESVPLRQRLWQQLNASEAETGALVAALVLGVKQGLDRGDMDAFVGTGTAHLFAISGLHIGMVAMLGYALTRGGLWLLLAVNIALFRRWIVPVGSGRLALLGSLVLVLAYAGLAGWSIPTQRAVVMLLAGSLAFLCSRRFSAGSSFGLALVAVLLIQPFSVLGAGFWLSFSAVAWIAVLWRHQPATRGRHKKVLVLQLLLPICLAPISAYWFGQGGLWGVVANLVLIPLVSFVVLPFCLLVCLLEAGWPGTGIALLGVLDCLYLGVVVGLEWLLALPTMPSLLVGINLPQLLLLQLGLLALLLPRKLGLSAIAGVLVLVSLIPGQASMREGEFQADLLDVGQGMAVVVRTRQHVLVYDTGPQFPSGFNTAEAVLLPFLNHQHIRKVNRLVFSHGDQDHSGGAEAFFDHVEVDEVISGEPERIPLDSVSPCQQGQNWEWDGVRFDVIWPVEGWWGQGNNRSCVIRISSRGQSLLLAGDIESEAEGSLLAQELGAELLLAPHHGSKSSSTEEFTTAVAPEVAYFAVGYRNHYRLPNSAVVERYQKQGVRVYLAPECGRLRYSMRGVSCFRDERWRRWRKFAA